jgi:DNA-directed RNA polymerase II subunit RPB2
MEAISWKIIDKYFRDNPSNLVAHHLDSYNDFFSNGINNIFRENNPLRFIERENKEKPDDPRKQALLYLGGKDGSKIYYGKPIIYDDNHAHFMYPNDARLRNMTYGITIHYDVEVDLIYYQPGEKGEMVKKEQTFTLEKIYLGRFPIMLQSNLCILQSLAKEVRFNMGECRNDYGGYFIIDGKEKVIVCQEKFADNMIYVRENKGDNTYSYSAEVRSVSEDASKPIRTTAVKIVAPTSVLSNNQLVVLVPNVRKPVPLFILMRALGVVSDKAIIETCLLNMEDYQQMVDLFIPSVHDASVIFTQEVALDFIATFTKRRTISGVLDILMNYFLPHVGEDNFLDKAYYVGMMVKKLLRVVTKEEKATDRDNFKFKRVESSGSLLYDLFREYYLIQKREISLKLDKAYYYHIPQYKNDFASLITDNYRDFFKDHTVEIGFRRAFKGSWGAETHTKRLGVVQDLNRLSWNSFISQMRKFNLPLDASAKVVGPRLLHCSQWGFIDPVDTPDGGNIGLHKHMSISTFVTSGYSSKTLISWLKKNTEMKSLTEMNDPKMISSMTKVVVNGNWVGVLENPMETMEEMKVYRRNGILPLQTSISFFYDSNELSLFTDAGRLSRPIYYVDDKQISFQRGKEFMEKIKTGKFNWEQAVGGFKEKKEDSGYSFKKNKVYHLNELYSGFHEESGGDKKREQHVTALKKTQAIIEYIDTQEEEGALIATRLEDFKKSKYTTHVEIDPSLILGVLGNLTIFAEHNPYARDAFSCGQTKQAVSVYHSNFGMRMDKMGVVLNYGQIPLVKSKYLEYINNEEQPYGVNTIVAIMSYTGYNVEDAILINEGSIHRGLFRTTYLTTYEDREESSAISGSSTNSYFTDVMKKQVVGLKPGYDYSMLDEWGLIRENTPLDDKTVLIGKVTSSTNESEVVVDASTYTKKGQMGFVDKSFITDGEEGLRIAKVRVREERLPAMGDKMASRAGQKGTLGQIIPEKDMPYTADGLKPDLIINPHAIPSRMTIGQLIESVLGIIGCQYGGFGDCTAFLNKGPNIDVYGRVLQNAGFHSSGNCVMYNGMTGEQLFSDIFMGPTYYMRLKHMVKDKVNYRARGPRTMLTRQTVQGRANDGGLRIGEMERDGIMAHGASAFLKESFMVRGDEYYMAVCNKTGTIAIYNPSQNIFLSPFSDGPVQFTTTVDGKMNVQTVSRFGRSFSIVRVPYSLKLLLQELQVMNVQMRIITEDNFDQLMNMSYSKNINQLMNLGEDSFEYLRTRYRRLIKDELNDVKEKTKIPNKREKPESSVENVATFVNETFGSPETPQSSTPESAPYNPGSPVYNPNYNPESPAYNPGSPVYDPNSPAYEPGSPAYDPTYNPNSPVYDPNSPTYHPTYDPNSPLYNPSTSETQEIQRVNLKENEQLGGGIITGETTFTPIVFEKMTENSGTSSLTSSIGSSSSSSILNVEEEKKEDTSTGDSSSSSDTSSGSSSTTSGEKKTITFT